MTKIKYDDAVIDVAANYISQHDIMTAHAAGIKRFQTAMYEIRGSVPTDRIVEAMLRHISIWDELRAAAVEENNWFVVVYCRTAANEMEATRQLVTTILTRMVEDLSPDEKPEGE